MHGQCERLRLVGSSARVPTLQEYVIPVLAVSGRSGLFLNTPAGLELAPGLVWLKKPNGDGECDACRSAHHCFADLRAHGSDSEAGILCA